MKFCRSLKIAVAGISAMALIPLGQTLAYAQSGDNDTYYPVQTEQDGKIVMPFERTFENAFGDYAVYGDKKGVGDYAFAYDSHICILTSNDRDDRQKLTYDHSSGVSRVDFDGDGNLYFCDVVNKTYTLTYSVDALKAVEYTGGHEFQNINNSLMLIEDGVFYTLDEDGELTYWNVGKKTTVGNGFSLLKSYGGEVYAVKEKKPYKISEGVEKELNLAYINTDSANNIKTGDTAKKLKEASRSVEIKRLKSNVYFTQIKLDEIGDTFTVDGEGGTQKSLSQMLCLVLCESGNATIFSIGSNCYITATENLEDGETDDKCTPTSDGKTYYAVTDVGVYASPFMCEGTRIGTLKSGADHPVKVTERFQHTVFKNKPDDNSTTEFCMVSYEEDGKTVTGFVSSNFLSVYNFSGEDNERNPNAGDDNFDYGTNVTSVVLAVIIVGLVIIAVLYLSMIGSKNTDKQKKQKKKSKLFAPRPEEENHEVEE